MAIMLLPTELNEEDEEFQLLFNYMDEMVELVPGNPHYNTYRVNGLGVPKDNTEINPVIIRLKYDNRLAIGHING